MMYSLAARVRALCLRMVVVRFVVLCGVFGACGTGVGWGQTTYTWTNANATNNWSDALNWTPNRTTPVANDIIVISAAGSIDIANIPNQTIGQLLISGGGNKTLESTVSGNILTISGGVGNDVNVATGTLLWLTNGISSNDVNISLNTGTNMNVQGGILLRGFIGGAGDFSISGSMETANPDGVNGSALGNGTIRVTGTVSYSFTNLGFWGGATINSGFNPQGSRPAINTLPAMYAGDGTRVNLDRTVTITGTLSLTDGGSRLSLGANSITFNDLSNPSMNGSIIGSPNANMTITKPGALSGILVFAVGGQNLVNLTLNGAGLQVTLGSSLTMMGTGVLTLTNGILTTGTNVLTLTNAAPAAIVGGSTTAYINGRLERFLTPGMNYDFPVGDATNYRPIRLNNVIGTTPHIRVTYAATGASSVDGTLLSVSAPNWRIEQISGLYNGATLERTDAGFTATNRWGRSTAPAGMYTSVSNAPAGAVLTSNTAAATAGYYAVGTVLLPTTFYFNAGDPANPTNWGSNPGGTGTPPADFTTAGNTYIMETGKTGALVGNLTFSVGTIFTMQSGSTLNFNIGNLTLNGAINLGGQFVGNPTSTLTIGGSGAITGTLAAAIGWQLGGLIINRTGSMINLTSMLTVYGVGANIIAGSLNCTSPNNLNLYANSTFAIGTNVTGSIFVPNGISLTNNGTITIPANNSFGLDGNATVSGNPISYISSTSRLFYSLLGNRGTSDIEFPQMMNGTVSIYNAPSTITFNNSKTVAGNFDIHGTVIVDIGASNTLTLNGPIITNLIFGDGFFTGGTNRSLVIGGTGTFTGNLNFSGVNQLQNLTINRASTTIPLGSALLINGTFTLTNGILNSNGNAFSILNTAPNAIIGGSATSYVQGRLIRNLVNVVSVDGTSYNFPVGDASNYRPLILQNVRTVGPLPPVVHVTFSGGTPMTGTGLTTPFADANRIWQVLATTEFSSSELVLSNLPTLAGTARLGVGAVATGAYNRVNSTPSGTSISSAGQITGGFGTTNQFVAIGTTVQNTYSWNLPGSGVWTVPANWSPTRSTPLPDDIIRIISPKDVFISGIPNETIGQLIIDTDSLGIGKVLSAATPGNILTISGGAGDDVAIGGTTKSTFQMRDGLIINMQAGTSFVVNSLSQLSVFAAPAAIRGAGTFSLLGNAALLTLNSDGINGVSAGTGAIQVTGAISYSPTSGYSFQGTTQSTGFAGIAGKPAITSCGFISNGSTTLTLDNNIVTDEVYGLNGVMNLNGKSLTTQNIINGFPAFLGFPDSVSFNGNNGNLIMTKPGIISSKIVFVGTPLQNLTLNGTGLQATLGSPLAINGALTLTSGRLLTSGANIPTLAATATVAGGSATSYVEGPMARQVVNGGTGYFFPIGKAGTYLPLRWDNIGGAGTLESEAFAAGSGGMAGAGLSSVSGTEYWRSQRTSGAVMSGQILLSRASAIAAGSVVGEANAAGGLYAGRGGTLTGNILTSAAITAFDGFYAIGGGLIFYYVSGDPLLPASWNTQQNGMGVAPMSLSATGTELVIDGNRTISVDMPFTLAMGVKLRIQAGSTLSIANGQTFTNNGTVEIFGTLEVQGSGAWSGTPPQYLAGTMPTTRPTLRYAGAMTATARTTGIELPTSDFGGDLVINNPAGITLASAVSLGTSGRLVLQNGILFGEAPNTLTITNTAFDAVSGGSASSFVVASLVRDLPPNLNNTGIVYPFPVGARIATANPVRFEYTPFALTQSSTGTMGARIEVSAREMPLSVSPGIGVAALSQQESWQARVLSGQYLGGGVVLQGRTVQSGNIVVFDGGGTAQRLGGTANGGAFTAYGFGASGVASERAVASLPSQFSLGTSAIPPVITGIRPDSAGAGYEVIIEGSGLTGLTSLSISGVPVAPSSYRILSDNRVAFNPAPNLNGAITVQSQRGTATSVQSFRFVSAPTLINPPSGSVSTGTVLLLNGTNFLGSTQSVNGSIPLQVLFGSLRATDVQILSPTQLRVVVPFTTANISAPMRITTAGGTIATASVVNIIAPPVVRGFTPSVGGIGTIILVTGANFTSQMTAALLNSSGGGLPVTVMFISSSQVSITLTGNQNFGATTPLTLNLTTPSGTVQASTPFTFIPAPRIDSVFSDGNTAPATTLQSGVEVRITGQNLVGVRSVSIGGTEVLSITEVSDREILVRPGGAGAGAIRIEAAGGVITSSQSFMFIQSPAIASVAPLVVTRGTVVVISGVNLGLVQSVSFGGVPASRFTVVSPLRIEAVVGAGASGVVTASDGMFTTNSPLGVRFISPPIITSLSPTRATAGTVITVRGESLNTITNAVIGDRAVLSFTAISATEARVVLGGDGSSNVIRFSTPFGDVLSPTAIDFVIGTQPLPPVVTGVQPSEGVPNTVITIAGSNFENVSRVLVGGVEAVFMRTSPTTLVVTVPSVASNVAAMGLQTSIDVVAGGTTVRVVQPFTFFSQVPVPLVNGINPSEGREGAIITITGENLNRVQSVFFGGVAATRIEATTATSIQVVLGQGATGAVELLTRTGQRIPTITNFRFIAPVVPPAPVVAQTPLQRDSAALTRLYSALGGADWRNRTGWLTNAPVSTWFGVETAPVQVLGQSVSTQANVRITALRLPTNGVTVSNAEAFATFFRSIQTQLSTTSSLNTVQDSTGLALLRVLDLSGNVLATTLPIDVLLLPNLQTLNLANTQLSGDLGTLCGRLQQLPGVSALALQNLDLSGNNLTGEIPDCLGINLPVSGIDQVRVTRYVNLRTLNLSNNRFSGIIFPSLLALPNIRVINLQNNMLGGEVPTLPRTTQFAHKASAESHSAESLEVLNVSQNRLVGKFPREIATLISLKELNIAQNFIDGNVPKEIGSMQALERFVADDNLLIGAIPEELTRLRNLRTLGLSNNRFTSAPNLAQIRALDTLRLEGNRLLFADIAPNIAVRALSFVPQDSVVGRALDTSAVAGSRLVLTARSTDGRAFGDAQTRYQWFKGGQRFGVLSTAPTLVFEVIALNDAGVYTCRITNLTIPNLAYQTQALTLRTTLPPAPQLAPQLVSPVNGAENLGLRPEFSWRTVQNAAAYQLELAQNQAFTALQRDTVFASTATWRVPLSFGTQYWWRVRAVSAGGESPYSEVRTFVTTTRELSVTLDTVNFGKVPARDRTVRQATLRNRGTAQITIKDITLEGDNESNFRIPTTVREVRLNPNENYSFEVDFTPRSAGEKLATVLISYTADGSGQASSTRLPGRLRGWASVLKIVPIQFDTVRVGDRTFTSALVINRGTTTLRLRSAQILDGRTSVFSFENALSARSLQIFPEDTSAVLMRCSAIAEGNVSDVLRVESPEDTAEAPITATARARRSTDVSAVIGFRTRVDSALPGANVVAELYIKSASPSLSDLFRANQPAVRAIVRLNRNVLVAASTESRVRVIRNAEVASNLMRIDIPPFSWNGRDSVLTQFNCTAIAGDTAFTPLTIETILWGAAAENRALRSNEQHIFLETAPVQVFKTSLCYEGGERLFEVSTRTALGVIQPNPSKDAALITLSLKDDDAITLTLYDVLGTPVQTVLAGKQSAGDHSVLLRTDTLPSGAYFLVLRTRTSVHQQRVEVVR